MEYTGWHWSEDTALLTGGKDKTLYYSIKRCFDVVLASLALMALLPLMVIVGILIKLDTRGPVFFVQERVGSRRKSKEGHLVWEVCTFPVYKFRSMVHNADETIHQEFIRAFVAGSLGEPSSSQIPFKLSQDPRITRVGRILRKSSLDEIPQLLNVLRGDMSLVGPRPVPVYEVAEYREAWHHERLATMPGITGLWQVKGRCQVSFEDMVRLDLEYVRNQSLWLDIKILFLTIPVTISGQGAD